MYSNWISAKINSSFFTSNRTSSNLSTHEWRCGFIKKDLVNGPNHVFGNHQHCLETYCDESGNVTKNQIPFLEDSGIIYHINASLDRVVVNSHSLIKNETSNRAELFMSLLCKFNAGKRLNLTQKGSFETRAYLAALSSEVQRILNRLKVMPQEIEAIEKGTGQWENSRYRSERQDTYCFPIWRSVTQATQYGLQNESVALQRFKNQKPPANRKSGIFIHDDTGFLAASPDEKGISRSTVQNQGKKKRKTKSDDQSQRTDDVLALVEGRIRSYNEDQFAIFGKNVAAKLRALPKETRLYTEKVINDLLFEAEMGNVTKNTRITSLANDSQNLNNFLSDGALRANTANHHNYNNLDQNTNHQHQGQTYLINTNISDTRSQAQTYYHTTTLQPQSLEINHPQQINNRSSDIGPISNFFGEYNPLIDDNTKTYN
ncbi:unnamed protein product [Psylliodes chrysocephalus]|uniref:Uncharacterized protein n=1 Tax=Psylliodes chrysocephalus TaxID=3402493 RepID=A0A9P0D041_9CUCU|nr:unnamed protein product [Psylliodes chrysocephala]